MAAKVYNEADCHKTDCGQEREELFRRLKILSKKYLTIMQINSQTKLCAVIGHPISHSMSPPIHNAAYQATKQNYVYLTFDFAQISDAIKAMKLLDIKEYAVTIPHKIEVMDYLDKIDPLAKKIKSVNTVINKHGKLYGYNTDIDGIERTFKKNRVNLKNKRVIMIGAGGVARTIGVVVKNQGGKLVIFDRRDSKSFALARGLKCQAEKLENLAKHDDYQVLINATPAGMYPQVKSMPVPKSFIKKNIVIFDVIYNPLQTQLLKEGKKKGCKCINGVDMFVEQAAKQFELLTGKKAPVKVMKKVFVRSL
jgi:shikimate dehydrogenase